LKICLFLEGSYPYVRGGVSSWVDTFIRNRPDHEFILWTICDFESKRGQFGYELPKNVVLVQENTLESALKLRVVKNARLRLTAAEKEAVYQLITCQEPDWPFLHHIFHDQKKNPVDLFMSEEFLDIIKAYALNDLPMASFLELFWTIRSMFLPLLYLMAQPIAEADLYHSLSTGYAGVIASLGSKKYNKPFVLSEHGIYTREREEEVLLSDWIGPEFKPMWASIFRMFSRLSYQSANRVTSLFGRASEIQRDLGCPPEKCEVVGNGIVIDQFASIPRKKPDGWVDIGAIVRITAIKDLKTLIYTFANLKQEVENVRLHIIGPVDDEEYYQECLSLVEFTGVKDVIFTGLVKMTTYLEKLDFTVLSSISEGQPYAVIESMAAGRPVVATNVGSCRELIEGGPGDDLGPAGICVPPMHQTELMHALLELCQNVEKRNAMAETGVKRASTYYNLSTVLSRYSEIYQKAVDQWQVSGLN
jgi:glycosyltransferase involved in cell wall biosynthesis